MIPAFLRPFLAGLLMVPLLSLAGWLTAHGHEVKRETVEQTVNWLLIVVIPVLYGLGVVLRRTLDKWINPGNAASSHVAAVEKALASDLKAGGVPGRLVSLPPDVVAAGGSPLPPIDESSLEGRWFRPPVDSPEPPHDQD